MKTSNFILSLLLVLFLISAPLAAQPNKGANMETPHKREFRMGIAGLTDEQAKKIEALRLTFRKEIFVIDNQLAELKAHQRTLSTADKADMKAIYTNIDAITQLQNQKMKKEADLRQQIRSLLNDEQRLQYDLKQNRKQDFKQKGKYGYLPCSEKYKDGGKRDQSNGGKCPQF